MGATFNAAMPFVTWRTNKLLRRIRLTPVRTEVPHTRPWVRYEFADPKLEALSSGQKILLRMGPAHRARAKALLHDLRGRVAKAGAAGAAG